MRSDSLPALENHAHPVSAIRLYGGKKSNACFGHAGWQFLRRVLTTGLLVAAIPANAVSANDDALWRPRLATPAMVALDSPASRQFTAEVRASSSATNWRASLANDLKTWPCQIVSPAFSTINRGTEPGWQIKVSVPAEAPPELFGLTISSSEGVSVQPQSVSIVPVFATNFYILHITDEQIVNQFHTDPSGQFHKGSGTWEEMNWMQEPVNLIHPRFVLITGDQIDFNGALDGWNHWPNWGLEPAGKKVFTREETLMVENRLSELYQDCHKGYHVAYVETPGNHDVTPPGKLLHGSSLDWHPISVLVYEKYFGQRSWSFRMGDFYVLMHDWSDAALRTWAAQDYEAAMHDPAIKYRLIGQHYHAKWSEAPTGTYPFTPAMCDLMLIGHGHKTATVQTAPYFIYMERAAFFWGTAGFFNFQRTADGWTCDQTMAPRDEAKDVLTLFTDNGVTQKVRANQPDTMNLTTNSVTIVNDLPQNFYDGRVRFILPKGIYRTVENGTILSQYECAHDTETAVLVRVNIPASGSITVSIPGERTSWAAPARVLVK
jgi:hypothetical protein